VDEFFDRLHSALPALFFKLIAAAPFDELANWPFVIGMMLSTYIAFALAFGIGILVTKGEFPKRRSRAWSGLYANVGYMGPGLTIAALGQASIVPTALIFLFDTVLLFTLVPFLMALGGWKSLSFGHTAWYVESALSPIPSISPRAWPYWPPIFMSSPGPIDAMLTFLKVVAPCALFTMGATVALRPLKSVPVEMPALLAVKLFVHPLLVWLILSWIGNFSREWAFTAVLMAALPPALNVFVIANQYRVYVERASTAILLAPCSRWRR
jgi:predicted permease